MNALEEIRARAAVVVPRVAGPGGPDPLLRAEMDRRDLLAMLDSVAGGDLTDLEMTRIQDGLDHTDNGGCWDQDCPGSLPWIVRRIITTRRPTATPATGPLAVEALLALSPKARDHWEFGQLGRERYGHDGFCVCGLCELLLTVHSGAPSWTEGRKS